LRRAGAAQAHRPAGRFVRALVALAALAVSAGAPAQRLIVVTSSAAPPFRQAVAGLQQAADGSVEVHAVSADNEAALGALAAAAERGAAIVTLGARADEIVAQAAPGVPVVSCMAAPADAPHAASGAISVPADVPISAQIAWMARLLPELHHVGLLFDPARNSQRVEALAPALALAGYTPLLAPVDGPAKLPQALGSLPNAVEAILALPDATVYTQQASRSLLLFSFRNRIPLIGLTESWVQAGALYAVDWDYAALGAYCGALAAHAAAGSAQADPPPPRPHVAVNLRTAAQMGLHWDAQALRGVDRTYQ
jgi:putative ABC transport system substrate-binding protein